MDLLIGGAHQGKLDYARSRFSLKDDEIYTCTRQAPPDRRARCLCRLEEYVRYCIQNGLAPDPDFREDAILLCRDISCGVVPMDAETRLWREETGRFLAALSRRADRVTRLFCGLPQILK